MKAKIIKDFFYQGPYCEGHYKPNTIFFYKEFDKLWHNENNCNDTFTDEFVRKHDTVFEIINDFEIGEIIYHRKSNTIIYVLGDGKGYGFRNEEWEKPSIGYNYMKFPEIWQQGDKEKFKELLLNKAERDYKGGVRFKNIFNDYEGVSLGKFTFVNEILYAWIGSNSQIAIFNVKTGEWAEIIDPKLLGTSKNGLPIYEGETYWIRHEDWSLQSLYLYEKMDNKSVEYFDVFETEEEMQEYIINNAKELRLSDLDCFDNDLMWRGKQIREHCQNLIEKRLNF